MNRADREQTHLKHTDLSIEDGYRKELELRRHKLPNVFYPMPEVIGKRHVVFTLDSWHALRRLGGSEKWVEWLDETIASFESLLNRQIPIIDFKDPDRGYVHFPTIRDRAQEERERGKPVFNTAPYEAYKHFYRDLKRFLIRGVQFGVWQNKRRGIQHDDTVASARGAYEIGRLYDAEYKPEPKFINRKFLVILEEDPAPLAYTYDKERGELRLDPSMDHRWRVYWHDQKMMLALPGFEPFILGNVLPRPDKEKLLTGWYEKRAQCLKRQERFLFMQLLLLFPDVKNVKYEANPYSELCKTFYQNCEDQRSDKRQKQRDHDDSLYLKHTRVEYWGLGVKYVYKFEIHARDYWPFIKGTKTPKVKTTPLDVDPVTMNYTRAKFTSEQKQMFTYKPMTDPQFFRWLAWRNAGGQRGSLIDRSIWYRKLKRFCASLFYDKGIVRWLCLDVREGHSFRWGPDDLSYAQKPEVNTIDGTTLESLILDHMWLSGNSYRGRNWKTYKREFYLFLFKRAEQIAERCAKNRLYFHALKSVVDSDDKEMSGFNIDTYNLDKIRDGVGMKRAKMGCGDEKVKIIPEKGGNADF